jgi:ketosteroid isomerase-like protein
MDAGDLVRKFFAHMDSEDADRVMDWMDDSFEFTVFFSTSADAPVTEFRGRMPEWRGYMAQRPPHDERPWHELVLVTGREDTGTAFGHTRLGSDVVAAFNATFRFDEAGNITRYFAARTPNVDL